MSHGCVGAAVEAGGEEAAAAPRAMTVERTISDGGLRLREAYQQISNLELSLVQVSHSVLRCDRLKVPQVAMGRIMPCLGLRAKGCASETLTTDQLLKASLT